MKLTRKARKKLARKLKANSTQENLLTRAFQNQVKKQLIERLKKATSEEEVDEIINGFSIAPLSQRIMNLSNSTFNSSADEFRTIVDAFIHNPKNVYLNLRAEGMLKNKTDFEPFMRAYRHNLSLIKDLPRDLAKGMKSAYMRGTSFRGTDFAAELYSRLGKRARVIIRTESAKISSTLTQARMQKIGLNAYIWSTSEDSRVRSAHALLDGVLFFWNDPPTIDNYQEHCGRFINCFSGDVKIKTLYGINKVYRREYFGDVYDLTFEDGTSVTVTPNHPFVTPLGFRAVKDLKEGDYVVGSSGFAHGDNIDDLVVSFEELYKFFALMCGRHLKCALSDRFDFHNDGIVDKEVDIVLVDSFLRSDFVSELFKFLSDFVFEESDVGGHSSVELTFKSAGVEFIGGVMLSAKGLISRFGYLFELLLRCILESDDVGLANSTLFDSVLIEEADYNTSVDLEFFGETQNRLTFIKFVNNFLRGEFVLRRAVSTDVEWESKTDKSILESVAFTSKHFSNYTDWNSVDDVHFVCLVKKVRRVSCSLFVHNIEHYTGIFQISPAIFVGNCRCVPIPITSIDDIRFPIKVAKNLNIQTKWVKGGKGKIDTTIVGGSIKRYSKEEFISEFGSKFV